MERLTFDEFRERFGHGTERRQELTERLAEWVTVARSAAGLQLIWVFGSFVTEKPGPNDLDFMAVVRRGYRIESVPGELQRYFDPEFCNSVLDLDLAIFVEGYTDVYVPDLVALLGTDAAGHVIAVEVEP